MAECAADMLAKIIHFLKELEGIEKAHQKFADAINKFRQDFDKILAERPYLVTVEGIVIEAPHVAEELAVLQEIIRKAGSSVKEIIKDTKKLLAAETKINTTKSEIVLPKVQTYEQARNKALEIIGEVDAHTGLPHPGKLKPCENKIAGRKWHGEKVIMRLDYDPIKGPHINVTDFSNGHGFKGLDIAIPFEGDEITIKNLLRHMNTTASLEQAKSALEKTGKASDLERIRIALNEGKK